MKGSIQAELSRLWKATPWRSGDISTSMATDSTGVSPDRTGFEPSESPDGVAPAAAG